MIDWHNAAEELHNLGLGNAEIAHLLMSQGAFDTDDYTKCYDRVRKYLGRLKAQPNKKQEIVQNFEPEQYDSDWNGNKRIKFAIMGDTQICSKYTQLTHLHNFYDVCKKSGVKNVYHTGDLCDGDQMRMGHQYELYCTGADEQTEEIIRVYPKVEGITTHFITGNHDASLYKRVGFDLGQAVARERPDMKYLGRDWAVINLTPKCTLELRHPWDGTAYAISYKLQKMIESFESGTKPSILAVGHYHKMEQLLYRGVHAFQTACFQSQTPFTRGKGISVTMGGWICEIEVDITGSIVSMKSEFIPYYFAVQNDYKNFK